MSARDAWVQAHLWLGLTLGVVGVVVGITGSILVFDTEIDGLLNPQRYAVSDVTHALPPSAYVEQATRAVPGARVALLRMPDAEGMPVVAFASTRGEGAAPARVYLDPLSARVLDVSTTGGLVGWVHGFHENLRLRERYGREIVGAVGIAMLVSSLTGICLWWPGAKRLGAALGFRRGLPLARNLHYTAGFYGFVLLATLSFTGTFIAFTDAGRIVVGAFLPVSFTARDMASPAGPSGARPIGVDEAIAIAEARHPGDKLWNVRLPAGPRGAYRVNLSEAGAAGFEPGLGSVVFIAPNGTVLRDVDARARTSGDAVLGAMRTLHSGDALGLVGRIAICAAGLLPGLFVVSGSLMWLRQRRAGSTTVRAR